MKILLLNQTFHPDVMATGQYLSEVAACLAGRKHEVTVLTSRRAYDDPHKIFPSREEWRGVRIVRVSSTGFGKGSKWRRAADFGTFMLSCFLKLMFSPRQDVVVALTSPPLISFLGAAWTKLRGAQFVYWVMDFNPDEAIAAGWLRPGSLAAGTLERISLFSLRNAAKIIALDHFMAERIQAKGIPPTNIAIIPPWSNDSEVRFDAEQRQKFREAHGLKDKFVVMYSGNHSPCHPLDTLLEAARALKEDATVSFCFIGGGSEFRRVQQLIARERLLHVLCLPYQPFSQLSSSLSAADLHVVVMGNDFVGLVHPCKIYNVLNVGAPILYIGPEPSHVTEILKALDGPVLNARAGHGEVQKVIEAIRRTREQTKGGRGTVERIQFDFALEKVLPKLVMELEKAGLNSEPNQIPHRD